MGLLGEIVGWGLGSSCNTPSPTHMQLDYIHLGSLAAYLVYISSFAVEYKAFWSFTACNKLHACLEYSKLCHDRPLGDHSPTAEKQGVF